MYRYVHIVLLSFACVLPASAPTEAAPDTQSTEFVYNKQTPAGVRVIVLESTVPVEKVEPRMHIPQRRNPDGSLVPPLRAYRYEFYTNRQVAGRSITRQVGERFVGITTEPPIILGSPLKVYDADVSDNRLIVLFKDRSTAYALAFGPIPDDPAQPVPASEARLMLDSEAHGYIIRDAKIGGTLDKGNMTVTITVSEVPEPYRFGLRLEAEKLDAFTLDAATEAAVRRRGRVRLPRPGPGLTTQPTTKP